MALRFRLERVNERARAKLGRRVVFQDYPEFSGSSRAKSCPAVPQVATGYRGITPPRRDDGSRAAYWVRRRLQPTAELDRAIDLIPYECCGWRTRRRLQSRMSLHPGYARRRRHNGGMSCPIDCPKPVLPSSCRQQMARLTRDVGPVPAMSKSTCRSHAPSVALRHAPLAQRPAEPRRRNSPPSPCKPARQANSSGAGASSAGHVRRKRGSRPRRLTVRRLATMTKRPS